MRTDNCDCYSLNCTSPMAFHLHSPYPPAGDQPEAIKQVTGGILQGERYQTLLGGTGSGKTFTVANVIQNVQRPTLVITHNKDRKSTRLNSSHVALSRMPS